MNFHTYTQGTNNIHVLLKPEIQNWHNGLQLTNAKPSHGIRIALTPRQSSTPTWERNHYAYARSDYQTS